MRASPGELGLDDYSTKGLWFWFVVIQLVWGWFVPFLLIAGVAFDWDARAAQGRLPGPNSFWIPLSFWALGLVLTLRVGIVLRRRGAASWRRLGGISLVAACVAAVAAVSFASLSARR